MVQKPLFRKPKDDEGNKNSHLAAIMSKAIICKTNRIKPVWVFDGVIPIDKFKIELSRSTSYGKGPLLKITKAMKQGKKE